MVDTAVVGVGALGAALTSAEQLVPGARIAAGAVGPEPSAVLGVRGLRYKDRATQLAMAAAALALADAGLPVNRADDPRTGVVASSNLGNLDTVCAVTDTLATRGVAGLSPMDLP